MLSTEQTEQTPTADEDSEMYLKAPLYMAFTSFNLYLTHDHLPEMYIM